MAANGVFCLEADWDSDLRKKDSVEPGLQYLERLGRIKYIHRDVGTGEELAYYLKEWTLRRYADYAVLYLGFHGDHDGQVQVGRELLELSEVLKPLEGKCEARTIYLGSCLLMGAEDVALTGLVKQTGAKAIVGYDKAVDWLESAAFELLLLDRLVQGWRSDAFYRGITRDYGQSAHQLGLVAATKTRVYRPEP